MEFLADQTGVDRVAQEAIALVTELRDALVINRQHPEDLPPKLVITARLDQAYLTGWLTGLVARALLHKALRAGEISKKELAARSRNFISTRSLDGLLGGEVFPDLAAALHRIFERGVRVYRDLDDMETALGLNNASAL